MVGIEEACPPADTGSGRGRRRQVVEDHAGNVGRVRSERSERSPPQSLPSARCNPYIHKRS